MCVVLGKGVEPRHLQNGDISWGWCPPLPQPPLGIVQPWRLGHGRKVTRRSARTIRPMGRGQACWPVSQPPSPTSLGLCPPTALGTGVLPAPFRATLSWYVLTLWPRASKVGMKFSQMLLLADTMSLSHFLFSIPPTPFSHRLLNSLVLSVATLYSLFIHSVSNPSSAFLRASAPPSHCWVCPCPFALAPIYGRAIPSLLLYRLGGGR